MTTAHTLDVPGAQLHYEVRGSGPVVLLAGSPMGAAPFAPLADALAVDHTVVTHPQVPGQCASFLRGELAHARVLPASSTAEAVRTVCHADRGNLQSLDGVRLPPSVARQ